MTVDQILHYTGASRASFYRWRSERGFPPPISPGNFHAEQVRDWWAANQFDVGRWPLAERT